jgi:hypothetical protein
MAGGCATAGLHRCGHLSREQVARAWAVQLLNVQLLVASTSIFNQELKIGQLLR